MPHNWHNLSHYGLRGHEQHAKELRMERMVNRWGWLIPAVFLVLGLVASWPASAAGNAPDVRGRFVLVLAGTATSQGGWGTTAFRIQPTVIGVFDSFKLCTGAGRELQARLNTDGYVLDFACVATGR